MYARGEEKVAFTLASLKFLSNFALERLFNPFITIMSDDKKKKLNEEELNEVTGGANVDSKGDDEILSAVKLL